MEAEEERGWKSIDRHVCSCCVNDLALAAALRKAEVAGQRCDFCGGVAAAPLDVLLKAFVAGLSNEYEDPGDGGVPWDGREGGYQVASVLETWDLVPEFWDVLTGEGLVEAVRQAMDRDKSWVEKDWVWRRRDEVLPDAWDAFCEMVKHETWDLTHQEPRDHEDVRTSAEIPAEAILGGLFIRVLR